ncbi:MAG: thermonuclease family protein [Pseudomonadota bacterium]
MRLGNSVIGLIILTLLSAQALADLRGRVVSVTDGDTVRILSADKTEHRVRLTGIDAPERGQAFGTASRDHLSSLIAGKAVFVESSKTDRYGRILGKIILDGRDINLEQVESGYAWWYRYYADEQSPTDRRLYGAAEAAAQEARRGLWADPNPVNPYEWRRSKRGR